MKVVTKESIHDTLVMGVIWWPRGPNPGMLVASIALDVRYVDETLTTY